MSPSEVGTSSRDAAHASGGRPVNSVRASHDSPAPNAPLVFALDEPVLDEEDTELFGESSADADLPVLLTANTHPGSKIALGSRRFTPSSAPASTIMRC